MEWNKGYSPEDMAAREHFAPEQNGCEKIEKEQRYCFKKHTSALLVYIK